MSIVSTYETWPADARKGRIGICSQCGQGPKTLTRLRANVCHACRMRGKLTVYAQNKRAAGICVYIGCKVSTEKYLCPTHARQQQAYKTSWSKRQAAAGFCTDCSAPAVPGRTRCAAHLLACSARYRAYYAKYLKTT